MTRWNVRCSKESCRARHVFPKHPDEYIRPRKCDRCGGTRFRVVRDRAKDRCATLCDCGGYQFVGPRTNGNAPHRKGSRFCWYRKDGTPRKPGDPDFEDPNYEEAVDGAAIVHELVPA